MDARVTWYRFESSNPQVRELDPTQVLSMVRSESIFDGQELRFTSTEHIPKGARLSYKLGDELREYVVTSVRSSYEGGRFVHEHIAPWSLYYDLSRSYRVSSSLTPGSNSLYNVFFACSRTEVSGEEFPWNQYQLPGSGFTVDMEYQDQVFPNTKWDGLVVALSKARHNSYALLAIWPDSILSVSTPSTSDARNCITDRKFALGYANATGQPSHWLELGVNVESMSRTVPDSDKHMRSWVLTGGDNGKTYPNLVPDGSGGWTHFRAETSMPLASEQHVARYQGGFVVVPKETEYVQNTYTQAEIQDSSSIRDTLRAAALYDMRDRNEKDDISYTVELSADAPPMSIGDTAVVVADGLPDPSGRLGYTKMAVLVSGMARDELTGRTTYTLGVPTGQILPKIQKRKGA